jgi:hypothetical protein
MEREEEKENSGGGDREGFALESHGTEFPSSGQ